MATLVLTAAGAALGGALLPGALLGLTGAQLGGALGGLVGSRIDGALFGGRTVTATGPRLQRIYVSLSSEGSPIPRAYGRVRLGGQVIWASRFREEADTDTQKVGGKGGGGVKAKTTRYRYYANLALGLCEGPIDGIGRIWADGTVVDLSDATIRIHHGTEEQEADPLIVAIEGADNAPAYRGLAYVVFEDLLLEPFGNRVPQLSVEVFRRLDPPDGAALERELRGVALIPGTGEFALETRLIRSVLGPGTTQAENMNNQLGQPDMLLALDQLDSSLPNCESVALVVSWFGDDLRAGHCTIAPRIERADKTTEPVTWSVAGIDRTHGRQVSQIDGHPAYGGTPSDAGVTATIRELKARGKRVVFYPFVLMDVPPGNARPDPYGGAAQAAFPWRGRITVDPAPGRAGSPDGTADAAAQVGAFFDAYRPMALHYARLCADAGGVDAFIIASELRGLTQVRDGAGAYPAVARLKALAAEVRAILGPAVKLTYAADWSEYFGHQPADGSGDVHFHLDPLWADANIDMVGIDNYMPLADWRDGTDHLDAQAGWPSTHDIGYLQANIRGGEGYDWFYAGDADRDAQIRTPITDGAAGKPWVFRYKDLWSWWANPHYDRSGGVEAESPTAWVPKSKPIWFTEFGCPAVDKGANQPNVFVDAKSSESALPHYSNGRRDALIQRRALQAAVEFWGKAENNPVSPTYGGPMVDAANLHAWCWDARPYPDFPARRDVWADADNWALGHWLSGRMGALDLSALVGAICEGVGFADFDASRLEGVVAGYILDQPMSPRAALESLMLAYRFDAVESGGLIRFVPRGGAPVLTVAADDLVAAERAEDDDYTLTRAQESDLPRAANLAYIDAFADYGAGSAAARRTATASARVAQADLPVVLDDAEAQAVAEAWLVDAWAEREQAAFGLPPAALALDPGDVVRLDAGGRSRPVRVTRVVEAGARQIEALAVAPSGPPGIAAAPRPRPVRAAPVFGPPVVTVLDLPILHEADQPQAPYIAGFADPWPGAVALYRSADGASFALVGTGGAPATLGETTTDFPAGPTGRWDEANTLTVWLWHGALASAAALQVLNGANAAALRNADGAWEVLQFRVAELIAPQTYRLTGLLRGQLGTEGAMRDPLAAGATFVLLDGAVTQVPLRMAERGLAFHYRAGPATRPYTDDSYVAFDFTARGVGLRPYSPVHVGAARDPASGDIAITWVRRTRVGGDSWEDADVPLGEEAEAYQVDILDEAGDVVRTLSTALPTATYGAAMQAADWGGAPPGPLSLCVYQLSATFGRGQGRKVMIDV